MPVYGDGPEKAPRPHEQPSLVCWSRHAAVSPAVCWPAKRETVQGKIANLFFNYGDDVQEQENWEGGRRGGGDGPRWDRTVACSNDSGDGAKDFSSSAKPNKTTPPV